MKNYYKKFGYYYDEVMAEMNYDLWLEFTQEYLNDGDSILDLACGTGTLATMLKLSGYNAYGLDLSESIIEIANEKKKINHLDIPFYVADMTNFKINEKFNVITCFFDSVNFLKTEKEIQDLFNCASSHLKNNGYFIIDVFSKVFFNEYENNEIKKDYDTFILDWTTKKVSSSSLRHQIKISEDDDTFVESYYEYYHEINTLKNKNFKLIKISGDFNDDYQLGDERILLVYQKL